jgi:hypothetical protein
MMTEPWNSTLAGLQVEDSAPRSLEPAFTVRYTVLAFSVKWHSARVLCSVFPTLSYNHNQQTGGWSQSTVCAGHLAGLLRTAGMITLLSGKF